MRYTIKLSFAALSFATAVSACSDARATDAAAQEDLKRDLQLAASATIDLATPKVDPALLTLESQPASTPEAARTVRKGAGDRAVRSRMPTVRATPEVEVAALEETEQVESMVEAPAEEAIDEPIAVAPRPVPVVVQTGGAGDYGTGSGGGIFGGGIGGVVIRGGGVDGDNCELHRRGRGRFGGPIVISRTPIPTSVGGIRGTRVFGGGATRQTTRPSVPRGGSSRGQTVSRPGFGRPRGR